MVLARPVASSSPSRDVRYDWPRFWVAQTGILDLSDAGFLRDPVDYPFGADALKPLSELDGYPVLALLGEPGIGKSTTLKLEHERLSALAAGRNSVSIYVDLRVSSSEERLYRQIFETAKIEAWTTGDSHLFLLLDSLDEAMLRIETVAHLLADGLRTLPTDRMSIRIACRTAVWPAATLGRDLRAIWGEAGLGTFELAPLRRRDVVTALSAHGIDLEEFIPKLFGAHAVAFAIKPLTLKMLLSLYQRDGRLPTSTADLYRQGCLELSEEQNDSRRDTGRRGHLNARQRLRLAGRIAAATVLGRRFAVWTGPEIEAPTEDVAVSALAGAREEGDFATFTATDDDVREVLDSGLFSSRGDARMGLAHQTYGEFLAALYLFEKGVPAETTFKALTHPRGGLIPPLAIMGAWAASLSPELRASLIATDPWTLLRGDLSSWSTADLAAQTASMLAYVEQGRSYEYFFGITESYEKLKHPDLADQLRAVTTNRSLKAITRRMALGIAERCELKELQTELIQLAVDKTEEPTVRAAAVSALRRCGDTSVPARILALLRSGIGPDPHTEIRGHALDLLWPDHITAGELFSLLTPSDEHYFGSYAHFLFELPNTLGTQDLLPALSWATVYIARSNHMGEFREKTLADAILFQAWKVFENPDLTDPFLAHIAARLHQHGDLCRGTDLKAEQAFMERLRDDQSRRRRFILHICRGSLDRIAAYSYRTAGIVTDEDFGWLLEVSPGGASPVVGLNEESLRILIALLFNIEDNAQFELLYPALERWELLRAQFAFLIDGVPLDSEDAFQARKRQEQLRELKERARPPAVADLPGEISRALARAENGEWQAWWQLNLTLTLTPESRAIGDEFNYFITSMSGWATSNESLKQRIVAAAERYLIDADTSAEIWLGQQQMRFQRNDLAAMRAFILLRQAAPDAYSRIPFTAWEKWTPVIVGLPRKGVADQSTVLREIVRDALTKAPQAFIATVKKMLQMEKECRGASTETPLPNGGPPFLILRDLEGCWDDEGLKAAMFEEMETSDIRPAEYAALLDALLDAGYEPAIEHGVARLSVLDECTTAIADVLLRRTPARVWPMLWPKLVADDELALAILTEAAGSFYLATPFYAAIGEEAIADLYLLMARLFPAERDPMGPSGFVGPFDTVPSLRDGAPRYLAAMGSEAAVRALRRLVAERPNTPLLPFELSRAELEMRLKTWSPLTTKEIFALTDRPSARLVTSAADLLDILLEALATFAAELHGAQTPVRDLWDLQPHNRGWRPIDENGLSDAITRFLRRELVGAAIFANREVEVSRRPGDPVGKRTDILINTFRRGTDGDPIDPIAAVIEVKGCWNREMLTALEDQLVRDYMVKLRAPVGIYLVGWFDTAHWDDTDPRRRRVPRADIDEVREQLDRQAAAAPEGFRVNAVVLEIRVPGA